MVLWGGGWGLKLPLSKPRKNYARDLKLGM